MTQQSHCWAYIQMKLSLKKTHAPTCSSQHYSQSLRHGNNLSVHWQMHKWRCVYIDNGTLFSQKQEQNSAICCNTNGTRDPHTKWSKSEKRRQIPYDITFILNLIYSTNKMFYRKKKKKLMDLENRLVFAKEEWERVGWTGSLGLVGPNYCIWNG